MIAFGLDLGKRKDFSALAAVDRREIAAPRPMDYVNWMYEQQAPRVVFEVPYLERWRLGTPYQDVAKRAADVVRSPAFGNDQRVLAMDATGLGAPVVEMVCAASPGCEVLPVTITSGVSQHYDGQLWHVPKVDLLAGLQGLLEREELKIAKGLGDCEALVKELVSVQAWSRGKGRLRLGADGFGEHDDLVMAMALGCWAARKRRDADKGMGRLYW